MMRESRRRCCSLFFFSRTSDIFLHPGCLFEPICLTSLYLLVHFLKGLFFYIPCQSRKTSRFHLLILRHPPRRRHGAAGSLLQVFNLFFSMQFTKFPWTIIWIGGDIREWSTATHYPVLKQCWWWWRKKCTQLECPLLSPIFTSCKDQPSKDIRDHTHISKINTRNSITQRIETF